MLRHAVINDTPQWLQSKYIFVFYKKNLIKINWKSQLCKTWVEDTRRDWTQRKKGKKGKNRETKKTVKPRVRQKGWGALNKKWNSFLTFHFSMLQLMFKVCHFLFLLKKLLIADIYWRKQAFQIFIPNFYFHTTIPVASEHNYTKEKRMNFEFKSKKSNLMLKYYNKCFYFKSLKIIIERMQNSECIFFITLFQDSRITSFCFSNWLDTVLNKNKFFAI